MNRTYGNKDNLTEAVHGLDIFTKNWCMNCEETEKQNDPIFRCKECLFLEKGKYCLIKTFALEHKNEHKYPMRNFGCMRWHCWRNLNRARSADTA